MISLFNLSIPRTCPDCPVHCQTSLLQSRFRAAKDLFEGCSLDDTPWGVESAGEHGKEVKVAVFVEGGEGGGG